MSAGIPERIAAVRARIGDAAARAGRDPAGVTLVGVSKTVPAERIAEAARAGLLDAGENRAQELRRKQDALGAFPALRWHFVGALQRNKAKDVAGRVALVHGVDSPEVAKALGRRAAAAGVVQDVLLEINVGGEGSKAGVAPDDAADAAGAIAAAAGVRLTGLMTIPPRGSEPEESRPYFAALRELRDRLAAAGYDGLRHLSMGMSADLEVAVEEGATIVRVGTAIFGPRPPVAGA